MIGANLGFEELGSAVIAAVDGEIDLANAEMVRAAVMEAVPDGTTGLVIDLSATTYVDSAGVGLLFELNDRMGQAGCDLVVVAPPGTPPRSLFEMVAFERVAPLVATREEGLKAITR